jgi:hypothetical protein
MLDHDNDIREAFTDDTDDTDYKMRYIMSKKLAARYTIAGKERGDPEQMPKAHFARAPCGDEEATLVKVHVRILLQPHTYSDSRTDFFMRVYGGTLDAAFKRFDVRGCFTETTENQRLECDPAPSPPPPDNWVVPPSPPAYVYEALTLATATGSSALFFVISAVCCIGIGGRTIRARHNSRMIGTPGLSRVDRMPTLPARYERHGEEFTGPFRPDHQQPGARLAPINSGFSFGGLTARYDPVRS